MGLNKLAQKCAIHGRVIDASGCPSCAVDHVDELCADLRRVLPKGTGLLVILWDDAGACGVGGTSDAAEAAQRLREIAAKIAPPAIVVPGRPS